MKTTLGIILIILVTLPLFATDTTNELLSAPHVKEKLAFRISGDKMSVAVDTSDTFVDVDDGAVFVLSKQRDLTFRKFNPFLYTITTSETTEKDPNFGSIAALLDAIQKTAVPGDIGLSEDGTPKTPDALRTEVNQSLRTTTVSAQAATAAADCTAYNALRETLIKLHGAFAKPFLSADELNGWVTASTSAQNITDVRGKIDNVVKQLNENVTLMKELDIAIGKRFIPGKPAEDPCTTVHASTFAMIYELARRLSTAIVAHTKLAEDLGALSKNLERYADANNWRPNNDTEYIFFRPTPSMENVKIVSVSIKPRKFSVQSGPALKVEEGTAVARSLRFRHFTRIVPEMAASIIKTDLKYPKYGTKEEGGVTKIESAGSDDFPAAGAVVLNGVCRCWSPTFVYPALQFGVTNSKDYPGFLIGGGFRFTHPRPFSIVAGYIYTWVNELTGKKVGDVVSGTAELEANLKRKGKRASYFGIQYNF